MEPPTTFAVNVPAAPLHTFGAVTFTTGNGFTFTLTVVSFEQLPLLTLTEYVVLDVGLTEMLEVVAPVLHV